MIINKKANAILLLVITMTIKTGPSYRSFFGVQPSCSFDANQRYSSYPYISSDTFRSMCNHVIDETDLPFNPDDVMEGDLVYVRGYSICLNEFLKYLPLIKHRFILITHNSDDTLPGPYEFLLNDPRLIAWFTQNKGSIEHLKLHALPIGIACNYWHYGDPEVLTEILTKPHGSGIKHYVYVNFKAQNNPQARDHVLDYFKDKPFCSFTDAKPWREYLLDLADSKFVLSPPGNGLDCYRPWEALLFGKIPIMISTSIDCLFDDLPVIIVNDWTQITEEFLEKKYQELQTQIYNLDKIYAGYWINRIKAVRTHALMALDPSHAVHESYSSTDCNQIPLDHTLVNIIDIKNGTFIEVGAFDGILQSNTKLLEKYYGWKGILIEPSANLFKKLCKNRPHSICFQCALGSFEENETYLYGDFDNGPMSSLTNRLERSQKSLVFLRSLQSILDECRLEHINFFSLDTEGYELNILKGIDFTKTTFDYLLIEIYVDQYTDIVSFLTSKGYDLVTCLSNYNRISNPGWDGTHNDYLFKRRTLQ